MSLHLVLGGITRRVREPKERAILEYVRLLAPDAGLAAGGPVGGVLAKIGVRLLGKRASRAAFRRKLDFELGVESFLAQDPELAAKAILGDPDQEEVVFRAYRSFMDARDPRLKGPLIRLTGNYLGCRPDAFFFSAATLFEELVGSDFDTLRIILDACLMTKDQDVVVAFIRRLPDDPDGERVEVSWTPSDEEKERGFGYLGATLGRGVVVCLALKKHALARECGAGGAGAWSSPGRMVVRLDQARRIRELLG